MALKQKTAKKLVKKGKRIVQVAALPYRLSESGELELLLLTSRETKRFVIPKGWPIKGRKEWEAAAIEAEEEAGVLGEISPVAIGGYTYWKRLKSAFVAVQVVVYPLQVSREMRNWRERSSRTREWVSVDQAIRLVDEPMLVSLIKEFGEARANVVGSQ